MARPRKHDPDRILDAARELVLAEGPRAASVGAIAAASDAPVGTLYHRFSSREGLLAEMWFRALERFQASYMREAAGAGDPVEAGVAMALSIVRFARTDPADVRLLLSLRRSDVFEADSAHRERLEAMNAPLRESVRELARALHGRAGKREVARVMLIVVDLPYGAVRRYATGDAPMPAWLEAEVAGMARSLLAAG
jgi:AcrR family transcriptional regulator